MNREKVIKGLECCLGSNDCDIEPKEDCPYKGMCLCEMALGIDILSLLKEQEAKAGHWISVNDGDIVAIDNDGFPERACFCSECKKYLIASDEYAVYGKYCPFCGAKMEGR